MTPVIAKHAIAGVGSCLLFQTAPIDLRALRAFAASIGTTSSAPPPLLRVADELPVVRTFLQATGFLERVVDCELGREPDVRRSRTRFLSSECRDEESCWWPKQRGLHLSLSLPSRAAPTLS